MRSPAPFSSAQAAWSRLGRAVRALGGGAERTTYWLAALEGFCLAELAVLAGLVKRSARYVSQNGGGGDGAVMLVVPLLAAALVRLGLPLVTRSPSSQGELLRWTKRLAPALFLWPLPPLLVRGAFSANEPFLLLLLAVAVLGLEWSLRGALATFHFEPPLRRLAARLPRWAPHALAALLVTCTFVFACHGSVRVHHKMLTSNLDFGLFENLFYNTLHGRPGEALGRHYFGEHAEFLLYVLLPFYALVPRSETLLVLQCFFIVGAAVPLHLLASRWLRSGWQGAALTVVYLALPAVHGSLFYDFHFLPLSAFFVLWAAFFYATRRWLAFWPAVALAAACREDVALGLGAVGLGLVLLGRDRRLAWALAGFGGAWFVLVKLVWMQRFGDQAFSDYYDDLIPPGAHGFSAVLRTLLQNPLYAMSRTLTADKLVLGLHLGIPLAFLAVRQPRTAVLLLPGLLVIGLATSRSAITQYQFHYAMHFVPYLFIAATVALAVRPRTWRYPVIAAMLVGALVSTVQFGAFFGKRFHTSFHDVSFDWTADDDARAKAFATLSARIPAKARVAAGEYEGPQLARRRRLLAVKEGVRDAEFVIYSKRSLRWGGDAQIHEARKNGSYRLVAEREDLVLLERKK
jgi:uncharacterized membrane protein